MQDQPQQILPLYSPPGPGRGLRSVAHETRSRVEHRPRPRANRTPQTKEPVAEKSAIFGLHASVPDEAYMVHQTAFEIGAALRRVDAAGGQLGFPNHRRKRPGGRKDLLE